MNGNNENRAITEDLLLKLVAAHKSKISEAAYKEFLDLVNRHAEYRLAFENLSLVVAKNPAFRSEQGERTRRGWIAPSELRNNLFSE